MPDETHLQQLMRQVLSSSKYQNIDHQFIKNLGKHELAKGRSLKEAVKAVKNKLHQVGGAYLAGSPGYKAWLRDLLEAANSDNPSRWRATCRQVMAHHASTKERLPILENFYTTTLSGLGPIQSVLDVACGLNPLAAPWMPLASGAEYHAVDIYHDMMAFMEGFFAIAGLHGSAETADVIESPPVYQVQLALVLKALPCLEQVDRTVGERLLRELQAEAILVSFPARSLGGRSKGMVENYEARFSEHVSGYPWQVQRFEFESELAFLIRK